MITSLARSSSATAFCNSTSVMKRRMVGLITTHVISHRFSGLGQRGRGLHDGFSDQTLLGRQSKQACWFWQGVRLILDSIGKSHARHLQIDIVYPQSNNIIEAYIKNQTGKLVKNTPKAKSIALPPNGKPTDDINCYLWWGYTLFSMWMCICKGCRRWVWGRGTV